MEAPDQGGAEDSSIHSVLLLVFFPARPDNVQAVPSSAHAVTACPFDHTWPLANIFSNGVGVGFKR